MVSLHVFLGNLEEVGVGVMLVGCSQLMLAMMEDWVATFDYNIADTYFIVLKMSFSYVR